MSFLTRTVLRRGNTGNGFSLCSAGSCSILNFGIRGQSIESVLDKLPTAEIAREEDGRYLVRAETFGDGIDMWLRYQGECVELVKKF